MIEPTLVVIHGAPASGKTRLAEWLAEAMQLPMLSKDDVKEVLFDYFPYDSGTQREKIEAASLDVLGIVLNGLMATGRNSYIIETAFAADHSQPELQRLVHMYSYNVVQVYCYASEPILRKRYIERATFGQRHPGHHDLRNVEGQPIPEKSPFHPLELPGQLIEVDTSDLESVNYLEILATITEAI